MNKLLVAVLASVTVCSATGVSGAGKPNILHIHADDHRPDGLQALGNPLLQTPNLDEVARRGFVFSHCYTQGSMIGAVCLPSRTMMLTGRSLFRIPGRGKEGDPARTLPAVIKAAGYETWHCGKSGNEYATGSTRSTPTS